jgi:hypothetical protein
MGSGSSRPSYTFLFLGIGRPPCNIASQHHTMHHYCALFPCVSLCVSLNVSPLSSPSLPPVTFRTLSLTHSDVSLPASL